MGARERKEADRKGRSDVPGRGNSMYKGLETKKTRKPMLSEELKYHRSGWTICTGQGMRGEGVWGGR